MATGARQFGDDWSPLAGLRSPFPRGGANLLAAYAAGGFDPAVVTDFAGEFYHAAGSSGAFSSVLTHARASTGRFTGSNGILQSVASGIERTGAYVHDGSSFQGPYLLLEPAATNLLLNSASLSTQSVTVTAVPHTLHFVNSGSITLSGAHSATLNGVGNTNEANRVSLTFTPTAGSLTLTVSGAVNSAQLEVGSVPTSFITTTGAAATRAADTLSVSAAKHDHDGSSPIAMVVDGRVTYADLGATVWQYQSDGGATRIFRNLLTSVGGYAGGVQLAVFNGGAGTSNESPVGSYAPGAGVAFNFGGRVNATNVQGSVDGSSVTAGASPGIPDLSAGSIDLTNALNAPLFLGKLRVWHDDIGQPGLVEATS